MAGPGPGRRGRAQPEDDVVRDRDRPGRPRHRARLRPARTQEPPGTRRTRTPGEAGFTFTPASRDGPPGGYGTWRLRTPGDGPGLIITLESLTTDPCDHRQETSGHDPGVKLQAPVPGPARHLHQPRLPPPRRPVRPGAQHPLRSRRPDLPLQHRPQMPPRPPPQATPQMDSRPAPRRHLPLDHPIGTDLHHRTHPLPHLAAAGIVGKRRRRYASLHHAGRQLPRTGLS